MHKIESQLIVGGNYTASDTDTNCTDGSFDVTACSDLSDGRQDFSVAKTGTTTRDMPSTVVISQ